jgi:hypothetical protein
LLTPKDWVVWCGVCGEVVEVVVKMARSEQLEVEAGRRREECRTRVVDELGVDVTRMDGGEGGGCFAAIPRHLPSPSH